jgi:hypothetical protein
MQQVEKPNLRLFAALTIASNTYAHHHPVENEYADY